MTDLQQIHQCDGPCLQTAEKIALMLLRSIPGHLEIRAISIRGQGGGIFVECYRDGADLVYEFDEKGALVMARKERES